MGEGEELEGGLEGGFARGGENREGIKNGDGVG